MGTPFVHLHVHSCYSLMWGPNTPEELCQAAARNGMEYLALTDTNGLYGLVRFLGAARSFGLRPLVGARIQNGPESAVVIAKTHAGYEHLCGLLSRRHLEAGFSLARCFPESPRDLAVLSSDEKLLKSLRSRAQCFAEVLPGSPGRKALKVAAELRVPPVAANAVFFARPEDRELHLLLRAIDENRTLSMLKPETTAEPERWLMPADMMAARFPHCPEALSNTTRLARSCRTDWSERFTAVFPSYRDRREDHFELLRERCRAGVRWRYGTADAAVEKRLAEELDLIRDKGYVDYFLVVADIVERRPLHCGRGSAAASLVAYLLGITHVDPLRHRLLFGRFLNPYRKDHPDIDVDFPWDERDDLLDEVRHAHGQERFAMVANHVGFGARAAVREVAKVYGRPAAEIGEITRRLGGWTRPGGIGERIREHPKFRGLTLDPPWPEIIRRASRLEPLPRYLSVHCGGVVLTPEPVSRYVPVQRSAKGVRLIQWEKDQAEEAGLVKIDLLGNRSLAVIRDALEAVRANTGKRLDYASLDPLQDPETLELMRKGDTMGIFYVESPAMRQLQRKTGRGDFKHLVIHSSIIRPAANRYIREYIRRLHGAPWEPLHPRLEKVLRETYGLMVYQEDVIRSAMALAAWSWAEADGLRRVLGKKSREAMADYRRRFYEGCAGQKIPRKVVDAVWEMFISFSGYSFCKPHSASYALVSFKSAYLKVHHPAEFMAAVLSNGGGYYKPLAYISEARRMGLEVLGPHINDSEWSCRGKGRTVRVGLGQLQGARKDVLEAILEERRRNGPFRSLQELLQRVKLPPSDGTVLVKSGALDELDGSHNRAQLLWLVETRLRSKLSRTRSVFPTLNETGKMLVPALPDTSSAKRWRQELETLGLVLSVHPLEACEPLGDLPRPVVPARDLAGHVGRRVYILGWPVTRKEVLTREGEPMEFVSFEDKTAIYETVFFPEAFAKFASHLDSERPYLLGGKVEEEFGAVSLTVESMQRVGSR